MLEGKSGSFGRAASSINHKAIFPALTSVSFFLKICLFVCLYVCLDVYECFHIYIKYTLPGCPWRPEDGVIASATAVTDSCNTSRGSPGT